VDAWAASDPGLFGYFGGGSLTEKSHGQCNMAFFASRYGVEGLYLLDEPESALSPRRQLELRDLVGRAASQGDAQFIVATHSPILLSLPGARILSFDGACVQPVAFEATDHFRLYRDFFAGLGLKTCPSIGRVFSSRAKGSAAGGVKSANLLRGRGAGRGPPFES